VPHSSLPIVGVASLTLSSLKMLNSCYIHVYALK
jgi:hypothetical protein